jgi:hypothetical protein
MITLATAAFGPALLTALVHLIIILIILAIIYYVGAWILGKVGAPAMIGTLWMILCVVIALYLIISFLLTLL